MISSGSFVALRYRNFRLIWLGLFVLFTGSTMQNAALLWHVSLLAPPDSKGLALGFLGLVKVVPTLVFSMISGVVADAADRRRLLLVTQTSLALAAAALAVLAFAGLSTLWPIYALSALAAAATAFDLPARQALIMTLVPRDQLPNAISLTTIVFQVAAVMGPSLGGVLLSTSGVAWAYVIGASSFAFVIGVLLLMDDEAVEVSAAPGGPERLTTDRQSTRSRVSLRALAEGLQFVFRSPLIRATILLDFFATFFASAKVLLPIVAQDLLRVGPTGYGWLYAAPSVGAMATSIVMVLMTDRIDRLGQTQLWTLTAYGAATVLFGLSRSFWLTFTCLAFIGAAESIAMIIRNIVRQLETPDHLRGRMVGVSMVFFMGGPQLGELEAGAVANWLGLRFSIVSGGIGCLIAAAWIAAATPTLRRYRRLQSGAAEGRTAAARAVG